MQDWRVERNPERKRGVTYQLALAGRDGIVLASDRCERNVSSDSNYAVRNKVRKIRLDRTAQYAWAYSGSEAGPFFAEQIFKGLGALPGGFSEEENLKAFEESSVRFTEEYGKHAQGPWPCSILFVCGSTRRMFKRKHFPPPQEMLEGFCFAGAEFNLAAFLPSRLYSPELCVDELAYLAAYSVRGAHDLDSAMVDGLDIAVYRDARHKFEFLDVRSLWNEAQKFDAEILKLLRAGSSRASLFGSRSHGAVKGILGKQRGKK